jgi:hypothetical protein
MSLSFGAGIFHANDFIRSRSSVSNSMRLDCHGFSDCFDIPLTAGVELL